MVLGSILLSAEPCWPGAKSSPCRVGDTRIESQFQEADRMWKMRNKLEQSYSEAKNILRNNFRTEWRQCLNTGTEEDSIHQLDRAAQVTIFRLRTGHCQLLSLLHRLKIPIQTNVHAAQVLKPPTTSCSPAPSLTLWDARHGPVQWTPTGSFGDRKRHCGRLQTSP